MEMNWGRLFSACLVFIGFTVLNYAMIMSFTEASDQHLMSLLVISVALLLDGAFFSKVFEDKDG